MATFVYLDETGNDGTKSAKQPVLKVVGILVPEEMVRPLSDKMRHVAHNYSKDMPDHTEFHGYELWHGIGHWKGKGPTALLEVFRELLNLLVELDLGVVHSGIHKKRFSQRYSGLEDGKEYLAALQFLIEKLEKDVSDTRLVVIADQANEHEFKAISMVTGMQNWGMGLYPGLPLTNIIDTLHFVSSAVNRGVQMADVVAFILQRCESGKYEHPAVASSLKDFHSTIMSRRITHREVWPAN